VNGLDDEQSSTEDLAEEAQQAAYAAAELSRSQDNDSSRKRKRKHQEVALEDLYMQRLAADEAKEETKRKSDVGRKRQKTANEPADDPEDSSSEVEEAGGRDMEEDEMIDEAAGSPVPQHESLAPSQDLNDVEKASRTVFLGNVSSSAITSKANKKTLSAHLTSFLASLPTQDPPHKLVSIRFRSTAYSSNVPKKAAFAKKELMDATTRSTNAYAVYSTQVAAREAAKRLNGTVVLDRHLRVDEVAHPAKMVSRRCVFIGNLSVVDDDSAIQAQAAAYQDRKPKKNKQPADVEEGLWREFGKVGTVESVRVVRDSKTRVGLGIAYVQFTDENAVEAALLMNDKKFPPLLPRKLRVERCKGMKRKPVSNGFKDSRSSAGSGYTRKATSQEMSLQGRAGKLLGRAGAANMRSSQRGRSNANTMPLGSSTIKTPEAIVFEGHRASSKQGKSGLKLGGSGKKKGKPRTRSSKRGAAWKASGGKKTST